MNNPNKQALIKIANAFDTYDHQHYAYKHNKNNPEIKPIKTDKCDVSNELSFNVQDLQYDMTGVPNKPVNKKAPKWSKELTHVFRRRPSVNGTGGGPAYGVDRKNPFTQA